MKNIPPFNGIYFNNVYLRYFQYIYFTLTIMIKLSNFKSGRERIEYSLRVIEVKLIIIF